MIEYTVKVDEAGTRCWYLNDKIHREDGPAREYAGGTKWWAVIRCDILSARGEEYL